MIIPLTAPRWHKQLSQLRPHAPFWVVPWLLERGSLTRRLMGVCPGTITVAIQREIWGRADGEEITALAVKRHSRVWLREVQLRCNNQPWVYARTVIPVPTLQGPAGYLMKLGNRPLGAVLFADPTVRRGQLELASLYHRHRLYQSASAHLTDQPNVLWGRRSLFWLGGKPLLVTEVFLPTLAKEKC